MHHWPAHNASHQKFIGMCHLGLRLSLLALGHLGAEMIPGALEQARRPQFLTAQIELCLGERVGRANLGRHILALRIVFEIVHQHEGIDDGLAERYRAMRFHQRSRTVAECVGQRRGHFDIVDRIR